MVLKISTETFWCHSLFCCSVRTITILHFVKMFVKGISASSYKSRTKCMDTWKRLAAVRGDWMEEGGGMS